MQLAQPAMFSNMATPYTLHLHLHPTQQVLKALGNDMFYMPHMITLDRDGGLWVTDVGLHQALKLDPADGKVLMQLGKKLTPGHDEEHLCKPTQVGFRVWGELLGWG